MRASTVILVLLLNSLSAMNYAGGYTSATDANSPPETYNEDPAASTNPYAAEPVEQPNITNHNTQQNNPTQPTNLQKNPMAYAPDNDPPVNRLANPPPPPPANQKPNEREDVGTAPNQPS